MNLRNTSYRWLGIAALTATALLTGCSTVREVNSTVQSFSSLQGIPVPPTYRLETLPSQQGQVHFPAVEAQAQHALARVGMIRDDSRPSLVVQISAVARYARDYASWPYYDPYWGPRWGWGMSYGRGWGMGFGGSMMMMDGPPLEYYRAVSIVMRDIKTQQIVYETSAQRQDVWTDDPAIFGILFDAALTGFPKPPEGPRNVRTVIQKNPPPTAAGTPLAPANTPATTAPAPAAPQAPAAASPVR
ncbi:MAG: hypothetical protein RR729_09940 [Comamonas sp.]